MLTVDEQDLLWEYKAFTQGLRSQAQTVVDNVFDSLVAASLSDMDSMVGYVAPALEAAQAAMSVGTEIYLDETMRLAGLEPVPGAAIDVSSVALRGVTADELLSRSGVTVYARLKDGQSIDRALHAGRLRAAKQVATNIQLAKTHTALAVLQRQPPDRVVGFRRVLVGRTNCALCVIASTQRYARGELAPIHPACDCEVTPIYGDRDPGWVVDPETLESAHKAIEGRFGVSAGDARAINAGELEGDIVRYRDVLLVRQHGEIGPVLTERKHKFYKPTDRASGG